MKNEYRRTLTRSQHEALVALSKGFYAIRRPTLKVLIRLGLVTVDRSPRVPGELVNPRLTDEGTAAVVIGWKGEPGPIDVRDPVASMAWSLWSKFEMAANDRGNTSMDAFKALPAKQRAGWFAVGREALERIDDVVERGMPPV